VPSDLYAHGLNNKNDLLLASLVSYCSVLKPLDYVDEGERERGRERYKCL
jgi:hypothetical protein